ncbi:MAG: hypothetical protein KAS86_01115 [Candidatus Omnitrophica bacterium]|nr:hypothetical protein [Candidatus Omnitrophota bacterium]
MDILSKAGEAGIIEKCPCGVVHIHVFCAGVTLHLSETAFMNFASMVRKASSRLVEDGLSGLLGEIGRKEAEG